MLCCEEGGVHCLAFRLLKDTLLAAYIDMQYPLIPTYSPSPLPSKSAASYCLLRYFEHSLCYCIIKRRPNEYYRTTGKLGRC